MISWENSIVWGSLVNLICGVQSRKRLGGRKDSPMPRLKIGNRVRDDEKLFSTQAMALGFIAQPPHNELRPSGFQSASECAPERRAAQGCNGPWRQDWR